MRLLRNGDRVTVRVAKWDDPKISRRVEAVINTNSIVSKIPAKTWKELDVKPAFKHWQTQKPADLVLFVSVRRFCSIFCSAYSVCLFLRPSILLLSFFLLVSACECPFIFAIV